MANTASGQAEAAVLPWQRVQDLYERSLYVSAYREASGSGMADRPASPEEMVLVGRLCRQLGDDRLGYRWFCRALHEDPAHPAARFHRAHAQLSAGHFFQVACQFSACPQLPGAGPEQQADWLCLGALTFAQFRDFQQAAT